MSSHALDRSASADLLRTGFHVTVERDGTALVLHLQGELDMATAAELRLVLARALGPGTSTITVDLTALTFIDSTGIGVLVGGLRQARDEGCGFSVLNPSRSVQKALRLTGVDHLMGIGSTS